jgi:hypothetical protein
LKLVSHLTILNGLHKNLTMAAAVYTQEQASQFLAHIDIPPKYRLENNPARDYAFLKALHVHMITAVPYENLLLHYSQERKVDMSPQTVFNKIVGKETRGRGGYCMENSVFFFHMLKALGFRVFPVGAKVKPRVNGVPTGDYSGWYENYALSRHLLCGSMFTYILQGTHSQHRDIP